MNEIAEPAVCQPEIPNYTRQFRGQFTINLTDPTLSDWDSFIRTLTAPSFSRSVPAAANSFFHSSAWARVLIETYGYTPHYLTVFEESTPAAALPIMEVSSLFTGRRAVSLPFSDHCAPLMLSRPAWSKALDEAMEFGRSRGWRYLEIRGALEPDLSETSSKTSSPGISGPNPNPAPGAFATYYQHTLPISGDYDDLFNGFDPAVRRAIRKAGRTRVTTELSHEIESVNEYYRLHCVTRRRHGVPPQPFRFFERIHKHVLEPGHGFVVTARYDGSPIAAAMFVHTGRDCVDGESGHRRATERRALPESGNRASGARRSDAPHLMGESGHRRATERRALPEGRIGSSARDGATRPTSCLYKFGASDPRFQGLRPNNLVMARAIQWCCENGMESLDFGRTEMNNEGLRRFKLGWGAQETEIHYFRYNLGRRALEVGRVAPRAPIVNPPLGRALAPQAPMADGPLGRALAPQAPIVDPALGRALAPQAPIINHEVGRALAPQAPIVHAKSTRSAPNALGSTLCRHLPLPILRLIGRLLYRHMG